MIKKADSLVSKIINRIDQLPLWIAGFFLQIVVFRPYFILGTASVFPWHDQLDENILNYVLTARHFGEHLSIIPEMMNGLNASALQPNAPLFIPLHLYFDTFTAFVLQYAFIFAVAFFGMYFCIREITSSNILSAVIAGVFTLLPFWPVYGCAVAGVPMVAYAIICLARKKHLLLSYLLITIFVTTSHLVLSGYGVLGFWTLWIIYSIYSKKSNAASICGYFYMIAAYVVENIDLFRELVFKTGGFVSHRSEFVNESVPFSAIIDQFLNGGQHDTSYHKYLIIPIIIMIAVGGFFFKKWDANRKTAYIFSIAVLVGFMLVIIVCALWRSAPVCAWRNTQDNIFRYFSMDRLFWLAPGVWFIEFALCIYLFWDLKKLALVQALLVLLLIAPTAKATVYGSYYYMSVNEMNNGYGITGYIPWENYYAEDVMSDIEKAIGRDMTTYRIGHIGINPTPALMHGFYTVDGYSCTYPLSYKHDFRKIIAEELEIFPDAAPYFDTWGSRCYLFNSQTGNAFMVGKNVDAKLTDLHFNWDKLKEMNCEYLFSCGEITDYEDSGLEFIGSFTSDTSYWNIWVYKLG